MPNASSVGGGGKGKRIFVAPSIYAVKDYGIEGQVFHTRFLKPKKKKLLLCLM
jgi:hypothetical protein